jgi:hypothetical protein
MATVPLECELDSYSVCGHGTCVNVSTASSEAGEWYCECLPSWGRSLVEPSSQRCLVLHPVVNAFLYAWLAASISIVGLVVRGLRRGRLNRLRAGLAMLSLGINIGVAIIGLVAASAASWNRSEGTLRGIAFLASQSLSVSLFASVNMALTVRTRREACACCRAPSLLHVLRLYPAAFFSLVLARL